MPTPSASAAPATFEIKSAVLPLVAVVLKTADLPTLEAEWKQRWGDTPDFFDGEPAVLDLAHLAAGAADAAAIDFAAVAALLRQWRLAPVAVRGGTAEQMQQAHAAGLVAAADSRDLPAPRGDAGPAASPTMAAPVSTPSTALVIDRPLRSGQQVYARGRDLVVLSMVNPGAEVIADGSIHVYAPLRGKAMAGVRGDAGARIFALALEPELVSIAGVYRTSENPWPEAVRGKAAQVRLDSSSDGDRLIFEPLNP